MGLGEVQVDDTAEWFASGLQCEKEKNKNQNLRTNIKEEDVVVVPPVVRVVGAAKDQQGFVINCQGDMVVTLAGRVSLHLRG